MFPIFLKLEGRQCLVVGAGSVAEGKVRGLLDAGAIVRVVAPKAVFQIRQWDSESKLKWEPREFAAGDLGGGVSIVIAATNSHEVNTQIFHEARLRGVLCNAVDDPENCDFYYPAVVNRGDLQIAISTNGRSPALAQRLRKDLEEQFGPEYEAWVEELGEAREQLNATHMDADARKKLLHELASRQAFESRKSSPNGRTN
jgi:precorrin-2 dehydrogenase / sirohydrochlorin ferrochelatase